MAKEITYHKTLVIHRFHLHSHPPHRRPTPYEHTACSYNGSIVWGSAADSGNELDNLTECNEKKNDRMLQSMWLTFLLFLPDRMTFKNLLHKIAANKGL